MIVFTKREQRVQTPLTWNYLQDGKKWSASIICSNGHYGVITDHDIAPDGTVTPSVVCPEPGCNFHDSIKLEGWDSPRLEQ